MNSPIEDYKYLKANKDITQIAEDTLYTKYLIRNDKGIKKVIDIDDTDQESLIVKKNGGFPIPGLMYTFYYIPDQPPTLLIEPGNEKYYVDYIPMVLCFNIIDQNTFSGINLNMLPHKERLKFLNEYYEVYKSFLQDVERQTQNNNIALNKDFISLVKDGKGIKFLKLLSQKTGGNFNYAYRKYKVKNVHFFRMIEFNEWKFIPFFTPSNAFIQLNTKIIHQLYYKTLNKDI